MPIRQIMPRGSVVTAILAGIALGFAVLAVFYVYDSFVISPNERSRQEKADYKSRAQPPSQLADTEGAQKGIKPTLSPLPVVSAPQDRFSFSPSPGATPSVPPSLLPSPIVVPPVSAPTPFVIPSPLWHPKIKFFMLTNVNTCIVGNACAGADCVNIWSTANPELAVMSYSKVAVVGKAPDQLTDAERNSAYCMNIRSDAGEFDAVKREINLFRDKVAQYTSNRISLDVDMIEINSGQGVGFDQIGNGFWQSPENVHRAILPYFTRDTDFTYVISGVKDPTKGTYFYGGLNGTLGADVNYGVSYSWSPKGINSQDAPSSETLLHEWLHQLAFTVNKINPPSPPFISYIWDGEFKYNGQIFSCQSVFNSPYFYFPPNADQAQHDPDFDACKNGFNGNWTAYCNSLVNQGFDSDECNRRWNKHLLIGHLNLERPIIGNACRNGRQDFDESAADSGGSCSIY